MTVLVTSPTGTVGRHLVPMLRDRGLDVRAFVRDPAADFGPGVDTFAGDFGDQASIRTAMSGVDQVWLATPNHPDQLAWETAIIDAAKDAGVTRVVKLSALDATIGSPVAFADTHARSAELLRSSGLRHVLIQPAFMMTNLFGAIGSVQQADAIFLPGAGAKVAMIDPHDIAAVAAAVLADPAAHAGRTYELTGREALTLAEVAAVLTAQGRPARYHEESIAEAYESRASFGAPRWQLDAWVSTYSAIAAGELAAVTDDVERLTGHPPLTLAAYLNTA